LRFHNFVFELEAELSWVREHRTLSDSTAVGANLHQAQTLDKKHRKLQAELDGHLPMITKTLENGKRLIKQDHPQKAEVILEFLRFHSIGSILYCVILLKKSQ